MIDINNQTVVQLVIEKQFDWDIIDAELSLREARNVDVECSHSDLLFILRHGETMNRPIPLSVLKMLVKRNHRCVNTNLLLVAFASAPKSPMATISFLLEHYHSVCHDDWTGKFLCDACFGYCPVNVEAIEMFLQKYPYALGYFDNSQKLLPIHKACQMKFRRRAKLENMRDSKTLFQVLLRETIRSHVCDRDSVGGLFESKDNSVVGMKMLIITVGEETAWEWVLSVMKELKDIPVVQAILRFDSNKFTHAKELLLNSQYAFASRDCDGHLPLHVAMKKHLNWEDGLNVIVEGNADALDEQLKGLSILPLDFMMFYSDSFTMTTLFETIRFSPIQLERSNFLREK